MDGRRTTGYGISPYVSRTAGGITVPTDYPREIRIRYFNTSMDYAIAELTDSDFNLVPIPISLEVLTADMDLKVYHCPVDTFNDEHVEDLTVFPQWTKTARPTAHHVACSVGLYSGSSGGPFISRTGGAVAMHVESVNSAKEIDTTAVRSMPVDNAIELISETVNSHANSHASFSRALVIRSCNALVHKLHELGII